MIDDQECVSSGVGSFRDGYPESKINGKTVRLHRVALERKLNRPIEPGMLALHTCGNRWCVREDHLYEGTHQDNMDDMKRSGRSKNCGLPRKLNVEQVEEIRKRLSAGEKGSVLAREFGVHKALISRIKNRKSYL